MGSNRSIMMVCALVPSLVFAQAPAPAPAPLAVPPAAPAAPLGPVPAAPAPLANSAPPAQELKVENVVIGKDEFTRMQREVLLLKKRLEEVELRAQIAAKMKDIERMNAPAMPVVQQTIVFKSMRQTVDGDRSARFVTSDGAVIVAREGDTLPNGMRVASIRSDSVTLQKGSVVKRLGVGGSHQTTMTAPGSTGAMPIGMPR